MGHKLIVLEGLDRAGKSTVATLLAARLHPSALIKFPNRHSITGGILDSFLKKDLVLSPVLAHLLYSANRYEEEENVKSLLEECHVICDRYWLSGAVYSAAKGLDFAWCKTADRYLPRPDFTFFIDISPDETSQRSAFGDEVHDSLEFQKKVYGVYKERVKDEGAYVIDGRQTPEGIADEIMGHLGCICDDVICDNII